MSALPFLLRVPFRDGSDVYVTGRDALTFRQRDAKRFYGRATASEARRVLLKMYPAVRRVILVALVPKGGKKSKEDFHYD